MMGETYDARRERTGWDEPHFDEGRAPVPPRATAASGVAALPWLSAREVAAPTVPLVAQRSEPVQVVEQLAPVSLNEIKPGCFYLRPWPEHRRLGSAARECSGGNAGHHPPR